MLRFFIILFFIFSGAVSFAQRGKDGNTTINTANKIVNEYTTLTFDATTGATTLNVAASSLNANNRFSGNLAAGDLIMIIQMQGAKILGAPDPVYPYYSTPDNTSWGEVTNYNNCGNYELCQVAAVTTSTSIEIDCGLTHSYTADGKVQIVRIPRYNTLTITAPGVLTCQTWNGTTGGILAVEVKGNTTINSGGKINVTGKGFRGAAVYVTGSNRSQFPWYSSTNTQMSANKGEGIAGFDNDYTPYGGKYGRGAAANAGGAGNVWNCGGGGGANAGATNAWTGLGIPDTSNTNWIAAWNIESPGYAYSYSSGGGKGGYSFSGSDENALVDAPNNTVWGGYARRDFGGVGGRPLDYSTGRIYLGGGGGSGEQDNNEGGAGGNGGGIIHFTSYGTITGSGNDSILADGNAGGNSQVSPPLTSYSGRDGSGGGGGGGVILFNTVNVSGVVLTARGGKGGSQIMASGALYFGARNEAEGPGGGGGGGYIAFSAGTVAQMADGGANGTTNSDGLTEFPPNGATKGGPGLLNQPLPVVSELLSNNDTICAGDTAILTATLNGVSPNGLTWYDAPAGGNSVGTDTAVITGLSATTTFYAGQCPGNYRIPVTVTVLSSNPTISINANPAGSVCPNTPITFTATSIGSASAPTYQWLVNGVPAGTNDSTFTTATLNNTDSVTCLLIQNSGCAAGDTATSNTIAISVSAALTADITITSNPANMACKATPVTYTATTVYSGFSPTYQWLLNGNPVGTNTSTYTNFSLSNGDVVTCVLYSSISCITNPTDTSNAIVITINELPVPEFTTSVNSGCQTPLCVQFNTTNSANYNSVTYYFGDGDSTLVANPQHCYTATGAYPVSIKVTDINGCSGATYASDTITVSPLPGASFSVSPATPVEASTPLTFSNTSTGNTSSWWNFNDSLSTSDTSSLTSPSYAYSDAGTYCIDLIVSSAAGCVDTTTQCVTVTITPLVIIPNTFTPNGDGQNDVFFITAKGMKDVSCSIFDRWGLKVAEWTGLTGNWNGSKASDGTYYYVIDITAMDGTTTTEKGYLQLLR